ncbi:MAG: DUF2723 domain-containing protein, partial [Flavobacteriales bacterium]|nr:DUF2723 domain-containing protein [Flavobacteriales bacterium]
MMTFNFKKWNNILGWTTFLIALITFTLTVEPTLSFWDCGEYIATSAKLQVGHPPGAPLFQMMGAFFAMFAPEASKVALMVNMMSVFSSAFTVLFLFWSLTILLKKVVSSFQNIGNYEGIAILGAAFVGAVGFTFTDSFWFNAVEAEVYAMASLFIAILFWLALRWEEEMHTPRGNKWLLLISLMIGLSFGVHFMALLTIPSMGLLYFFKNYKTVTIKSFIIANIIVVAILLFIFKMLLPLTMSLFGKTEVFMVNTFGLPFDSGTIFMTLVLIAFFYFGLKYTKNKNLPQYNTLLLCVLFIFIGFSTWMMLPIRANANVVINENRPSDAREVLAYYNREQYPQNPLFYGPQFTDMFAGLDPDEPYLDKAPNYERDYKTGKYIITNNYINATQNSHGDHKTILPRMWSSDNAENYMKFTNVVNFKIDPEYAHEEELVDIVAQFKQAYASGRLDDEDYITFLKSYGNYLIVEKPSSIDNLKFMFEYQFGYMYVRYLLWNFVGRQSDVQGKYDNEGNWLSGIDFIDEIFLGSQKNLPQDVLKNKGRNTYYFLPFILGILGMVFHYKKDIKGFYVLFVLFLFTGIALKVYLNERPFEPRERDYALVGSFYVFAIWIGLGVYAFFDFIRKWLNPKIALPVVLVLTLLANPVLLANQNWDDHDRSNKYTALANAKGYLESCEPNAILFTIGDNDTFPLWYAQEIEGIRRDVRVVNTQLFMTDWHIDQMKAKAYDSEPLPISFDRNLYVGDKLDYVISNEITQNRWELKNFLGFIKSDDPNTLLETQSGQSIHFFPTTKIRIPVDKNAVIKNKVVSEKYYDSIVPYMDIDIKDRAIYKARIMMFDIIQNNNWERPIYFTGGSFSDEDYLWMKEYLQLDGLVYKLVPIKTPINEDAPMDMGQIDSDKMYDIVMKWDWGNGERTDIYHDVETRRNSITYRTNLSRLMQQLILEEKNEKAEKVIELALTKMPIDYYGYYTMVEPFAGGYYSIGKTE